MLAHILAIAIGLSSLVLFFTAFSMSEIHRKDDFLWSGIGLFYALVLWFCASRITGSLLLGQIAAVTLVLVFNWQTLQLRKAIANPEAVAEQDLFSLTGLIGGLFKGSPQPASQPNIAQVLEEEAAVETVTPPSANLETLSTIEVTRSEKVSTAIPETTETEGFTSASENVETSPLEAELSTTTNEIEVSTPVSEASIDTDIDRVATDVAFSEEIVDATEDFTSVNENLEAQTTTKESSWEEESLTVENEDLENLIGSTTSSNPITEIDEPNESEIMMTAREDREELTEIESVEPMQLNDSETLEEIIMSQETTETEEQNRTTSEFGLMPPVENIESENSTDEDISLSPNEDKSQSSLDDFLAELENNINKKPNQDN